MDFLTIGIDGVSYAGKSTLCDSFAEHFCVVPETPAFSDHLAQFVFADTKQKVIDNSRTTLILERRRTGFITSKSQKGKCFLLDRSIFSYMAISIAYKKIQMVDYVVPYLTAILNFCRDGLFVIPDYFIHLNVAQETVEERMKLEPSQAESYWTSPEFNRAVNESLSTIAIVYNNQGRLLSSLDLQKVVNKEIELVHLDVKFRNELLESVIQNLLSYI